MTNKEQLDILSLNRRIANTLLGRTITGVVFDNDNRVTDLEEITLELDNGARVKFGIFEEEYEFEHGPCGLDVTIRPRADEEGKVFRL